MNRELRDRIVTHDDLDLFDRIAGRVLAAIIVTSLVYFGAHALAYLTG